VLFFPGRRYIVKKKWIIRLIISVLLISITGYVVKFLRTDDRPKVVVVLKDADTQYWEIVKAGAEKGFRDFDIDGKVIAPRYGSEADAQGFMLKSILAEHPDALVVSPFESPLVMSSLKEAAQSKIPVLLIDTDIPLENKTTYIGTDNFELGQKAGELLASGLQPGDKVALIAGDLTSSVISERIKGAILSFEAAGIKIAVEKTELPNESLPVRAAMTTILQQYPDVKGVFATTDIMALSALEVIRKHGNSIPVMGVDGIVKMLESIEEGVVPDTVAQNPYDMGYISVETAWKVIQGENVRKTVDTGIDLITKDNAEQKLDFLKKLLK